MKPRLIFRPETRAKIVEAFNQLNLSTSARGESFLVTVDEALEFVEAFPLACPLSFDQVRHKNLSKFPYALLYPVRDAEEERLITIIGCIHERSKPQKWRVDE